MAPATAGTVEVQRHSNSPTWYIGHILDVAKDGTLSIGFEGEVWPKMTLPPTSVRKPPRPLAEPDKFDPQTGDEVELKLNSSEHAPAGWGVAVIRSVKHGFYFVARRGSSSGDAGGDVIVERDMLRPRTPPGNCLNTAALGQETFKLPPQLLDWAATEDAMGCFAHIEDQTGLLTVQARVSKGGLKLVGETKKIARAKMLLDVHVKHQLEIQKFQDMREKRIGALEVKRNRIEGAGYKHSVEVSVPTSFVARIIGKKGEAIRALEQKYDVTIRILDDGGEQAEDRIVRIFGNNLEAIESARAEVEYIEEVLPVEAQMNSWILGRGGRTIQTFKESTGLVYARLDREGQQLCLCGTRSAVEDAVAMFETHVMYYPVFNQMDDEMEQIINQLEELGDYNARWEWGWYRDEGGDDNVAKGKGKGKAGGKGKYGSKVSNWKGSSGWEDTAGQRSQQLATRPAKGGKGKTGKSSYSDQQVEDEDDWDEGDYGGESEEYDKGKGRGKSARGRGTGGRGATSKGELSEKQTAQRAEKPAPPPPASRRMGKKGLRS